MCFSEGLAINAMRSVRFTHQSFLHTVTSVIGGCPAFSIMIVNMDSELNEAGSGAFSLCGFVDALYPLAAPPTRLSLYKVMVVILVVNSIPI